MTFSKNKILLLGWTISLSVILSLTGLAQEDWGDQYKNIVDRKLEVTANFGWTSYYGDLSIYDSDFAGKIANESGLAFGIVGTVRLTPEIGVSGQLIVGKVNAAKANASFESNILEYNLHMRLNLLRLFIPGRVPRLNAEVMFGFGNFLFNSTKTTYSEGGNSVEKHSSRVPELVFFGGGGISYMINDKMSIGSELTLHQFQNDKIDITVKSGDFDYFTYLTFGFTYYFRSKQKTAPRNKARIAHENHRRKALEP